MAAGGNVDDGERAREEEAPLQDQVVDGKLICNATQVTGIIILLFSLGTIPLLHCTYGIVVHPLYRRRRLWRMLHDAREIYCGPRVDVQIRATH